MSFNTLIPLEVLSGQFIYNFTSDNVLNMKRFTFNTESYSK